jgi:hypothetical protein
VRKYISDRSSISRTDGKGRVRASALCADMQ